MILISSNKNKIEEIKSILSPEIDFEVRQVEYPEIRSYSAEEISSTAAKQLAEELQETVIVEDSGIFIEALNDFPGTYSKTVTNKIGLNGYIKLMEGVENRACTYRSVIGYCEPGEDPITFTGTEKGTVAKAVLGDKGWGHDPIFIPEGSTQTYAETGRPKGIGLFRINSTTKLKEFLTTRNN